jgi:hypothetical protein
MTTINQAITIQYASNVGGIAQPGDCGPNSPCKTHDIVPVNSGDACPHQDTTAGHSIAPPAEDQPPNNDVIKSKSKSKSKSVTFDTSPSGSCGYEASLSSSSSSNSSNSFNPSVAEPSHSNPDYVPLETRRE